MLYLKAFHLISMVAWFAGLFYLPRLFVYHCQAKHLEERARFVIMETKLYRIIMQPAAFLTVFFGLILLKTHGWALYKQDAWLHLKLSLVLVLIGFHFYCGHLTRTFAQDQNRHSEVFYRYLNEVPTIILIACVILSVVKPRLGF